MYYIIKQPYLLRRWANLTCGLVNRDSGICHCISGNMWNILECCDGTVNMDYVFMLPSQQTVFQKLLKGDYIAPAKSGERLAEDQKPRSLSFDYVRSIHWSVTGKCNLRCRHCYMSAPRQKYPDLSPDEADSLIRQMAEADIHQISLTGGEPLLRKDFWRIISNIKAANIYLRQIFTNGLLVTDEFLERARKEELKCDFVLSFDGCGMHDWLRGINGTEKRTIDAIRRIKKHGYSVCIETAVHNKNVSVLQPTYQLMKELHIDFWKCSYITESGEWKHENTNIPLSQKQLYSMYDKLISMNRDDGYPLSMQLDGYYAFHKKYQREYIPYQEKGKEYYSCTSCITEPYLLPNGRLLPCPSFTDTVIEETMPLITSQNLTGIFQDNDGPFYRITHIRADEVTEYNKKCHDCIHHPQCKGGCRAMALLASGNIYGRDKMICSYFNMAAASTLRLGQRQTNIPGCSAPPNAGII